MILAIYACGIGVSHSPRAHTGTHARYSAIRDVTPACAARGMCSELLVRCEEEDTVWFLGGTEPPDERGNTVPPRRDGYSSDRPAPANPDLHIE